MADESSTLPAISVNIKGPSELKLSVSISPSSTVQEFKQAIASQCPKEHGIDPAALRLVYSGKILKDDDVLSKYSLKEGNTVHMVKGAPRAPAAGASGSSPAGGAAAGSAPTAASSASTAAGVPANFAAGQQIAGNPLAPLLNAQNAHAFGGFNPFAQMGVNPNDPNYVQNMMNDPAVQQQVQGMLQNPEVIDQLIEASPELRSMGPQVRQIMQSDHFRNLITNPDAMRQMHQLQQMMGAGGGGGGMGGASPFGGLGANPFGGAGAQAGAAPGTGGEQGQQAGARSPPPNPFAMFGGGGAGAGGANAGAGAGGMPDFGQLMAALGGVGGGGLGSFGGFGGAPQQPQQPPEERFQSQLTQLQEMGFYDGQQNIRALLACGGNVQAAVAWLLEQPPQ